MGTTGSLLRERVVVAAIIVVNVVSVVGVVAFNKALYSSPFNFNFPSSLMAFHFGCTWAFVVFSHKMGWFDEKRIEWTRYVGLGAAQAASVSFVNLSLVYNSMGLYQVLKFTNILVICVMEYFWMGKTYSLAIYTCLLVLVCGISTATVSQISISWVGLFWGLAGSIATAVYQITNKKIQTEFEVTPMQLLQFEQPWTALFAALFACATENVVSLFTLTYTPLLLCFLIGSGIFAFGVNLSCYLIIGKTSPVTYGVVGHTKTVGILLLGIFLLHDSVTTKSMIGIILAFLSIVAYTHITTSAATAAAAARASAYLRPLPSEMPALQSPASAHVFYRKSPRPQDRPHSRSQSHEYSQEELHPDIILVKERASREEMTSQEDWP